MLTGALGSVEVDIGHFWRVLKHLDVTCGTFVEASSADCTTIPDRIFGAATPFVRWSQICSMNGAGLPEASLK